MARVTERHVGYLDETEGEDGPGINDLGAGISDLVPEITTRNYDLDIRYYIWYMPTYTQMHGFVKWSRPIVVATPLAVTSHTPRKGLPGRH